MRRAARKDANQAQIENALQRIGAVVKDTSALGNGFPDVVAKYRGRVWLLEIKDGTKPASAQKLTEAEQKFHTDFAGCVYVVNSVDAAIQVVTQQAIKKAEEV